MIRLNIKTYNKIQVKSFTNKNDLEIYCRNLCLLVGNDYQSFINEAKKLADKIYNTNVGQSFKSDLGYIISVAGKSRAGNIMYGGK